MAKTNLQIRIPEDLDSQIAALAPKSKSSFVREAIEEKIHREIDKKREAKWIQALKKNPEDSKDSGTWLKAESWEPQ